MMDSLINGSTTEILTNTKGLTGSIVRILPSDQLLEIQLDGTLDPKTMPGIRARGFKSVLVDLSSCLRVHDDKGSEKTHDDRTAWFSKDEDWAILSFGQRVKVETRGTREIPAPLVLQNGGRSSTHAVVHTASAFHLMSSAAVDAAKGMTVGCFEGAIVRLLAAEKMIEVNVETVAGSSCAGQTGETVLLYIGNALMRSEKLSLTHGLRVRVSYSGVRVMAAARDDAVIYEATTVELR
jgi:hypothetical protein